jgi:hypothetical protein
MRFLPLIFASLVSALPIPAVALPAAGLSWGKPSVPLDEYARDTNECADASRTVAIAIKPGTLRALDALSFTALLDIAMQASSSPDFSPMMFVQGASTDHSAAGIARRTNTFDGKFVAMTRADVSDELQAVIDKCLTERGYVRIALTSNQRKHLARLRRGSAERTAYLHAVDTDPTVIDQQRLVPAP